MDINDATKILAANAAMTAVRQFCEELAPYNQRGQLEVVSIAAELFADVDVTMLQEAAQQLKEYLDGEAVEG